MAKYVASICDNIVQMIRISPPPKYFNNWGLNGLYSKSHKFDSHLKQWQLIKIRIRILLTKSNICLTFFKIGAAVAFITNSKLMHNFLLFCVQCPVGFRVLGSVVRANNCTKCRWSQQIQVKIKHVFSKVFSNRFCRFVTPTFYIIEF